MTNLPWNSSKSVPADAAAPEPMDVHAEAAGSQAAQAIGLQQADCCASRAMFRVVIPTSPVRPHSTELLLCGHHHRLSHDSLERVGATVYDGVGRRLVWSRD